jgi:hypothetical protein
MHAYVFILGVILLFLVRRTQVPSMAPGIWQLKNDKNIYTEVLLLQDLPIDQILL